MNFHELVTIKVTRTDPETGIAYEFTATPPIDISILTSIPGFSFSDFIVSFSWRALAGVGSEAFPNLRQQIADVLPLLLILVKDIRVSSDDNSEFLDIEKGEQFSASIERENSTRWQGITPEPSDKFSDLIEREVFNSPAVLLGLKAYTSNVLAEIAQEEQAKQDERRQAENQTTPQQSNIKMGLNGLGQMFISAMPAGKDMKASIDSWEKKTGQIIEQPLFDYGIDLNEIPLRVLEGILWQFSKTNYKGNVEPKKKEDILLKFSAIDSIDNLPRLYQNIKEIPRLQIGKRELLRLADMNYDHQRDTERATQALIELGTTQFCFYYTRLAINKDGKAEKDKDGDWKKEEVTAFDTLLDVKQVKDEKTGQFKYYEISPSPIFLDQKERYFMLIPFGWRQEVQKLVGTKKASSYTYLFLLFLRYQFEQKRRKNAKAKSSGRQRYEIVGHWSTIAQALRMPETIYRRKPDRALSILDNAYAAAKQLGYLTSYSRIGQTDRLVLNAEKYPAPNVELGESN